MRNKYLMLLIMVSVAANLLLAWQVLAGNPDSPGLPTDLASESYTLEDIYQRLIAGAAGTKSTFTEPAAAPGTGTMHTLNDIMDAAPTADNTNGATTADVRAGKTFWGLNAAGGGWGLRTGIGTIATYPTMLPKTGDSYDDVCCTGEDGELQKGVAWPNPRFTINGDGTVTDNLTGLMWLQNANCAGVRRNWATALSDVAQLNTDGTMNSKDCGDTSDGGSHQTDWRLPNLRELHSLAHYGVSDPAVPNTAGTGQWSAGDPFNDVQSDGYWSGSSFADDPSIAWPVDLWYGDMYATVKTNTNYVWPVRGGP
jgi:hypothetical protein